MEPGGAVVRAPRVCLGGCSDLEPGGGEGTGEKRLGRGEPAPGRRAGGRTCGSHSSRLALRSRPQDGDSDCSAGAGWEEGTLVVTSPGSAGAGTTQSR